MESNKFRVGRWSLILLFCLFHLAIEMESGSLAIVVGCRNIGVYNSDTWSAATAIDKAANYLIVYSYVSTPIR